MAILALGKSCSQLSFRSVIPCILKKRHSGPSSLNQCPEQTLGTGSIPTPTTPKESPTPRCSNTPRIRDEETTTIIPTPIVTGTPGIQRHRNSHPDSSTGSILVWTSALSRPRTLAPHLVPQHPEKVRLPGHLRCLGSKDPRIIGSQRHLNLKSSDTIRITGGIACSQGQQGQETLEITRWR